MNHEHYKTFLYVARYQSATKAAKELYTSQPAVTRSIKLLEDELGCHLFVRSKYGMELTQEGETLYEYIRTAFSLIEQGEALISKSTSVEEGQITIGATITALDEFLFPFMEKYHRAHPKVKYKLFTQSSNQTIQKLNSGFIDIAFVTTPYSRNDDQTTYELKEFDNIVIAGKQFSYLKDKKLSLEELSKLPFVLLNKRMQLREYVDELFKSHGLFVEPTVEIDAAHMIVQMVKHNYGVGISPRSLVKQALENGDVIELHLEAPLDKRKVMAIVNKTHPQSDLLKSFIDEIRKEKVRKI